jgi:hypothetical protein
VDGLGVVCCRSCLFVLLHSVHTTLITCLPSACSLPGRAARVHPPDPQADRARIEAERKAAEVARLAKESAEARAAAAEEIARLAAETEHRNAVEADLCVLNPNAVWQWLGLLALPVALAVGTECRCCCCSVAAAARLLLLLFRAADAAAVLGDRYVTTG